MKLALATLFVAFGGTAFAQQYEQIQARITGTSGDRGKCTIDIVVDATVEIEISGTQGRMRALSGARPTWRRLECNMAMPQNPAEFKFSPQDGRGRQSLVREPGQNRGVTVVRIEDSNGGSEGYKFDLEWRGTTGGSIGNNGGFGNGNNGGFGNGGNNDSIFDRPGNGNGKGNGNNGNGKGPQNWNQQVNYQGRGDGYFRNFKGGDDQFSDCSVTIDRNGRVEVQLSKNRDRMTLTGRLISADRNRLVADMTGGGFQGPMDIRLDNRNRVQELAMTGSGRNRFELRWQQR